MRLHENFLIMIKIEKSVIDHLLHTRIFENLSILLYLLLQISLVKYDIANVSRTSNIKLFHDPPCFIRYSI